MRYNHAPYTWYRQFEYVETGCRYCGEPCMAPVLTREPRYPDEFDMNTVEPTCSTECAHRNAQWVRWIRESNDAAIHCRPEPSLPMGKRAADAIAARTLSLVGT